MPKKSDTKSVSQNPTATFKRRYPRRQFFTRVGALIQGQYFTENTVELGEKGMMFTTDVAMKVGDQLVVSFFIPGGYCVITRALVRYQNVAKTSSRVGIEFTTVSFEDRRALRDYISQRKELSLNDIEQS